MFYKFFSFMIIFLMYCDFSFNFYVCRRIPSMIKGLTAERMHYSIIWQNFKSNIKQFSFYYCYDWEFYYKYYYTFCESSNVTSRYKHSTREISNTSSHLRVPPILYPQPTLRSGLNSTLPIWSCWESLHIPGRVRASCLLTSALVNRQGENANRSRKGETFTYILYNIHPRPHDFHS